MSEQPEEQIRLENTRLSLALADIAAAKDARRLIQKLLKPESLPKGEGSILNGASMNWARLIQYSNHKELEVI